MQGQISASDIQVLAFRSDLVVIWIGIAHECKDDRVCVTWLISSSQQLPVLTYSHREGAVLESSVWCTIATTEK
jgi:hypothetical protein